MVSRTLKKRLSIQILQDPDEILKFLYIGTNIPIWSEFYQYIKNDLIYFKAKLILLLENGNPLGVSLIFEKDKRELFFGFFGVINNNTNKIEFLINQLINYAKEKGYELIQGPINIPVIIYGWGFMKEGSSESLYIGKPINPQIYPDLFLKSGFMIKHEDFTWMGSPYPKFDPWKLKNYDFNEYEYFNPKDIDDFLSYKSEFLRIHAENLPTSSRITPNVEGVIDNYVDFIFKYGKNFMIFLIKYKPTKEIVACGAYIPNPFRKNTKGNYDSVDIYTWAVDPNYRRKGLVMLMYGATSLKLWEHNIKYAAGRVPNDNLANTGMAYKLSAIHSRTHIVLEYKL